MQFDLWLTFVAASSVLLLIPGPTILLVLSYALSQGRQVAIASAAGVALGDLIAITASLMGLGALVLASATAFMIVKYIGAAYLIWMGVKLLISAQKGATYLPGATATTSPKAIFRHTAAVTALNPKSIGFFIAFVPQFIHPEAALAPQFAIIIATFVGLAALNALAYALLADRLRRFIAQPAAIRWLTRGGGVALITMGAITATLRRSTP